MTTIFVTSIFPYQKKRSLDCYSGNLFELFWNLIFMILGILRWPVLEEPAEILGCIVLWWKRSVSRCTGARCFGFLRFFYERNGYLWVPCLKRTACPWKNGGLEDEAILFGMAQFQGRTVSFRECTLESKPQIFCLSSLGVWRKTPSKTLLCPAG